MKKLEKAELFGELKMVMPKVRGEEGTEAKPFLAGNETKVTKIAEPFVEGTKPFVAVEVTAHRRLATIFEPEELTEVDIKKLREPPRSILFEKASGRFKETARDYEKADDKRDAEALLLIEVMPETAERITKECKAARSRELGSLGQGWMEGFGS